MADRVKPETVVLTENTSGQVFYDITDFLAEMKFDKIRVGDSAEKADTLTVRSLSVGKIPVVGESPNCGLRITTDREYALPKLVLVKMTEKVGLVLDRVNAP